MLSRKEPQHVLGINEHQTSSGFSSMATSSKLANFTSTSILRLQNSPQQQAISVKLTDDCFEALQRACQQNHEVLVHVDRKGITIEIKTSSSTSIKFDCYLQRVSGAVFRVLQRDQNAYNDIANISMRAQVKPTEKTFESSREKAQVVSKHLEEESSKCKTQMLQGPVKPGDRKFDFKSRMIGKPSIPSPRNGSILLSSVASSSPRSSPKVSPPMRIVKSSKDSSLRERIIHYIICGKFSTQNEVVDFILSEGLPSDVKSDSAKRKIREIICEVAEEFHNPAKLVLLPKYHSQVDLNWAFFSPEERSKAEKALAETTVEAGTNFAPLRASTRGPLMAPRAKSKKEPTKSPTMNNSTTTSPELVSDGSSCSTPSPVDQNQLNQNENDSDSSSSNHKRKSQLMENFRSAGFIDGSPPNKKSRNIVEESGPTVVQTKKVENVAHPNGTEKYEVKPEPKLKEKEKSTKSEKSSSSENSDRSNKVKKSLPDNIEKKEKPLAKPVSKTEIQHSTSSSEKPVNSGLRLKDKDREVSKINAKEEKPSSRKTESSSAEFKKTEKTEKNKKEKNEKTKKEEKKNKVKEFVDYTVPRKPDKNSEKTRSGDSKKSKNEKSEKSHSSESKKSEKSKHSEKEKITVKMFEKLSKPVNRESQKDSDNLRDLKSMPLRELLSLFSDPMKPSKDYEQKYPPIKNRSTAKVYAEHEVEYYKNYENAYDHLLTVQNHLRTFVERMNNAKTDSERITLEEKIRNYATNCINDASYRDHRRTVANMTKAIQVLRNRMDDFYSQNPNQHQ